MHEMRPSRYDMLPVEQALDTVLRLTPLLAAQRVPLAQMRGRFLAEDFYAAESLPPFAASWVDGYAVNTGDGRASRRVVAEITAGRLLPRPLAAGTATRIMTGAPLPDGADAVVMVEQSAEVAGSVSFSCAPRAGENVIPIGLDVTAGQLVLARGAAVGGAEISLLATMGCVEVAATRRPTVAVLSTGDELVEASDPPARGQVRDGNRPALLAAVEEAGGIGISLGIVRDDAVEQEQRIREGLDGADVLITSGGVSVGSRDLIKPILERLGRVHFGRVAMKPGKPLTFATVGGKLAFGLPGFPVSSLVAFELFVRPALLKMQGAAQIARPVLSVVLANEVNRTADRVEFQRARVSTEDGRLVARTTGPQSSSRLLSLVGANALLRISPGDGVVRAGEEVSAILLGTLA